MTRTDQVIADSGLQITDLERTALSLEAGRASNMTGGRYSDHLRSELATFQRLGSAEYLRMHQQATSIARELGY